MMTQLGETGEQSHRVWTGQDKYEMAFDKRWVAIDPHAEMFGWHFSLKVIKPLDVSDWRSKALETNKANAWEVRGMYNYAFVFTYCIGLIICLHYIEFHYILLWVAIVLQFRWKIWYEWRARYRPPWKTLEGINIVEEVIRSTRDNNIEDSTPC